MGILKNLTDEYFGKTIREEDKIDISDLDVEIVSFTDKNGKFHRHGYRVKDSHDDIKMIKILRRLIERIVEMRGDECSLNDIDMSNIKSVRYEGGISFFAFSNFNGDVSGWDVSNFTDMYCMFSNSDFTGENGIFRLENGNNVEDMSYMFRDSKFNTNIDDWVVNDKCKIKGMFTGSPLSRYKKLPKWYKERQK